MNHIKHSCLYIHEESFQHPGTCLANSIGADMITPEMNPGTTKNAY